VTERSEGTHERGTAGTRVGMTGRTTIRLTTGTSTGAGVGAKEGS
jgi:hypothetical protein